MQAERGHTFPECSQPNGDGGIQAVGDDPERKDESMGAPRYEVQSRFDTIRHGEGSEVGE